MHRDVSANLQPHTNFQIMFALEIGSLNAIIATVLMIAGSVLFC